MVPEVLKTRVGPKAAKLLEECRLIWKIVSRKKRTEKKRDHKIGRAHV